MKAPPRSGPITDDIPNILDIIAIKIGRLAKGTLTPMIVMLPENRALAPAPATARPTISMTEFLAAAHITEPTSKRIRAEI